MPKRLVVLAIGLTLVACEKQAGDGAGATLSNLVLSVRCIDDEVSKDSNGEEIQVSLKGFDLTYKLTHSGFGAEHATDVYTTVKLSADEIARIERWIAEGGLMQIASLNDTSQVEPGPHHRRGLSVSIELRGRKHEFSLDGIRSVKGHLTAFGGRDDLSKAELFVTRLTDLMRDKDPELFGPENLKGSASAEPATPERRPSFRYRLEQWSLRVGVFLMAMVILGFLAISALFLPPAGAWFIYFFLLPFLVWLPGMTLHPAAGWVLAGVWLVSFPVLRRWLHTTPSGKRWVERWGRFVALFEGGDPAAARWGGFSSAGSRRSSSRGSRGGKSSTFSGRGGRFGGGGSSSRW